MPAELPSNEQIFTETSRLVPLRATLPEGEKVADGMRCWYESCRHGNLVPSPWETGCLQGCFNADQNHSEDRNAPITNSHGAAYNETQPNDIID